MIRRSDKIPPKIIFWGGTGQAKVNRPIAEDMGMDLVAVFDDTPGLKPPFADVELMCGYKEFQEWTKGKDLGQIGFSVAIGNPHGRTRIELHQRLVEEGLVPVTLIHHAAWVSKNAVIGSGSQVMAGAVIGPEAKIGEDCIINTNASVDHECILEDGTEVAPGATLCGCVRMGVNAWVCAGATVIPRVKIGADAVVGAGAVVLEDVPPGLTVVGIPAKPLELKTAR